jgi:chemotaxis protein CheZ
MNPHPVATDDSEDLESLFDSIVAANSDKPGREEGSAGHAMDCPGVIHEVGRITRILHDSLRDLGYDKQLKNAASEIPDTRDRLNYIATMTEKAAVKVLNAIEAAQPDVERMKAESTRLDLEWQKLFNQQLDVEQFKRLVEATRSHLKDSAAAASRTSAYLTDIMMAQDFQDLTGQVIKKVVDVTQNLEQQLLRLLVQNASPETKINSSLLNGPVVNAAGLTDVVTSQAQVDELLESLGF